MVLSRIFPTEIHALHLTVDTEIFMEEWKLCVQNKKYDISKLLEILEPYVDHWYSLLTDYKYPRDIQVASLYACLDSQDYGGLAVVEAWLEQVDDLKAELRYVLCEVIRYTQYYPTNAKPIMAEYVFALLFRNYLRDHIKRELESDLVAVTASRAILETETVDLEIPDIYLVKNAPSNRWEKYLLYLISNGFTTIEIASIVKLPRETFYYEEKRIWDQLKKLWQQTTQ